MAGWRCRSGGRLAARAAQAQELGKKGTANAGRRRGTRPLPIPCQPESQLASAAAKHSAAPQKHPAAAEVRARAFRSACTMWFSWRNTIARATSSAVATTPARSRLPSKRRKQPALSASRSVPRSQYSRTSRTLGGWGGWGRLGAVGARLGRLGAGGGGLGAGGGRLGTVGGRLGAVGAGWGRLGAVVGGGAGPQCSSAPRSRLRPGLHRSAHPGVECPTRTKDRGETPSPQAREASNELEPAPCRLHRAPPPTRPHAPPSCAPPRRARPGDRPPPPRCRPAAGSPRGRGTRCAAARCPGPAGRRTCRCARSAECGGVCVGVCGPRAGARGAC